MSTITNPNPAQIPAAQIQTSERLDDEPQIVEAAPEAQPTDSHELANADHEEKGAAQINHGQTEVRDLGWNESLEEVPNPVVGGLENEELWTLIRRFNKVRFHFCQEFKD